MFIERSGGEDNILNKEAYFFSQINNSSPCKRKLQHEKEKITKAKKNKIKCEQKNQN